MVGQTLVSITAWIFSFGPSDKYDRAQQVSAKTSASEWLNNSAKTGKADDTIEKSGGGTFPRHKLDTAHTELRVIDKREQLFNNL